MVRAKRALSDGWERVAAEHGAAPRQMRGGRAWLEGYAGGLWLAALAGRSGEPALPRRLWQAGCTPADTLGTRKSRAQASGRRAFARGAVNGIEARCAAQARRDERPAVHAR